MLTLVYRPDPYAQTPAFGIPLAWVPVSPSYTPARADTHTHTHTRARCVSRMVDSSGSGITNTALRATSESSHPSARVLMLLALAKHRHPYGSYQNRSTTGIITTTSSWPAPWTDMLWSGSGSRTLGLLWGGRWRRSWRACSWLYKIRNVRCWHTADDNMAAGRFHRPVWA